MNSSKASDAVFDALFKQAVIDNFYEELDSLPPDAVLADQFPFSQAHEIRMRKVFTREAIVIKIGVILKWSRRVAVFIALTVAILFSALMLVPQVRAAVVMTITEWYEKFVMFTSSAPESEKSNLEPQYIPEGFSEVIREEQEMLTLIFYMNDEGTIIAFQSSRSADSTSVDNEMVEYSVSVVDDVEFHYFVPSSGSEESTIVWEKHNQRYTITSTISIEELTSIALSVK